MADRTLVGPALRPECSRNASHIQRLAAPPRQVGAPAYRPRRSAQRPRVAPALLDSCTSRAWRLRFHQRCPAPAAPVNTVTTVGKLPAKLGLPAWLLYLLIKLHVSIDEPRVPTL